MKELLQAVEVTQEDIDEAERFCNRCPVALALQRATGKEWWVTGWQAENENGVRLTLPGTVVQFIMDFDMDRPVSPFSFEA